MKDVFSTIYARSLKTGNVSGSRENCVYIANCATEFLYGNNNKGDILEYLLQKVKESRQDIEIGKLADIIVEYIYDQERKKKQLSKDETVTNYRTRRPKDPQGLIEKKTFYY